MPTDVNGVRAATLYVTLRCKSTSRPEWETTILPHIARLHAIRMSPPQGPVADADRDNPRVSVHYIWPAPPESFFALEERKMAQQAEEMGCFSIKRCSDPTLLTLRGSQGPCWAGPSCVKMGTRWLNLPVEYVAVVEFDSGGFLRTGVHKLTTAI